MTNIYIFSNGLFFINHNNQKYEINKNCICKIEKALTSETCIVYDNFGSYTLNFSNLKSCNYYRTWQYNNNVFIELICTSFNNITQKISTKNFDLFFYDNSIRIINNTICSTVHFVNDSLSSAIEFEECLYIFNDNYLLILNIKNNCFSRFKINKIAKNNKNYEILCKINEYFEYFLYFDINSDKQTVEIKKLKKENKLKNDTLLPYLVFYLCKNNFDEVHNYLINNFPIKNAQEYLQKFDNIIEIENEFYLYNNTSLTNIKFLINNSLVEDID